MCKAIAEKNTEDRRCKCDTSEARRLRRHTRDAIDRNTQFAVPPTEPHYYPNPVIDTPYTVESVKAEINSIGPTIAQLREKGTRSDNVMAAVDEKLNTVGAGIEYLAETEYGAPSDEQIREAHSSFKDSYLEAKQKALDIGMDEEAANDYAAEAVDVEFSAKMQTLFEQRNDAVKKALNSVGVEFANPDTLEYAKGSDKEAVELLKKSIQFYPQSWIDASNELHRKGSPLSVKSLNSGASRAAYIQRPPKWKVFKQKSTLVIGEPDNDFVSGGMSMGVHEFAHRVEHSVPAIRHYENFFLKRRSGNYDYYGATPSNAETPTIIHSENDQPRDEIEYGYRDNFPTHYMGRVYEDDYYEILSMGMESLFTGNNGGLSGILKYKEDPDYKRFVLGVLATSASEKKLY